MKNKVCLQASKITKQFVQGNSTIEVLKGIDVDFEQGKSYAIAGESGSGKSTLLHILAGIDKPDSGFVMFDGKEIGQLKPHEHEKFLNQSVGLLFQQPYLIKELTVLENVMLKGMISHKNNLEHEAVKLLERVGLREKAHEFPATLSGGQQQRVALVRALMNKPSFLLADEPTAHLDVQTGKATIELLRECQEQWSMGLIICSHDEYVSKAMEKTFHLRNGKIS